MWVCACDEGQQAGLRRHTLSPSLLLFDRPSIFLCVQSHRSPLVLRNRSHSDRDNDKERAYGGPNVERQIFGIFLNCFVILFSFAGALSPSSALSSSSPSRVLYVTLLSLAGARGGRQLARARSFGAQTRIVA